MELMEVSGKYSKSPNTDATTSKKSKSYHVSFFDLKFCMTMRHAASRMVKTLRHMTCHFFLVAEKEYTTKQIVSHIVTISLSKATSPPPCLTRIDTSQIELKMLAWHILLWSTKWPFYALVLQWMLYSSLFELWKIAITFSCYSSKIYCCLSQCLKSVVFPPFFGYTI